MSAPGISTKEGDDYRLPTDVKPTHYSITLCTDLKASTFDGVVKIEYVHRTLIYFDRI